MILGETVRIYDICILIKSQERMSAIQAPGVFFRLSQHWLRRWTLCY